MTVANNYAPVVAAGNGSTTVFTGSWNAISASNLVVQLLNTTTGAYTTVTQGTGAAQYQVTSLTASGFIITFNTAPATGFNVVISRSTAQQQAVPYTTSRGFQGGIEENSFDQLTAMVQELNTLLTNGVRAPIGDAIANLILPIASLRANGALLFDASGNAVIGALTSAIVSNAMQPVVAANTISAALALLGVCGNFTAPATVASASTADLGLATSNIVNITGTTTINGFGNSASAANPLYVVTFAGALQLTYNATSMILPGAANITTAAGDSALMLYLGSGNWKMLAYNSAISKAQPVQSSFKNLKHQWASNTTTTLTADAIIVTDGAGNYYQRNSLNLTLNTALTGAGGLDTGATAANTWYYVFEIFNPTTVTDALIMSLSSTAPTLPAGYVAKSGAIGVVRLDGSKNILGFIQSGRVFKYTVGNNLSSLPVISSSLSGNAITPTWIANSITSVVPVAVSNRIFGVLIEIATGSTNGQACAPNNSYGGLLTTSNPPPVATDFGGASGATEMRQFDFILESNNIYSAGDSFGQLRCSGFELNI